MKESVVNIDILLKHKVKNKDNNISVDIIFNKNVITNIDMDSILENVCELWDGEPEALLDILYSLKKSIVSSGGRAWKMKWPH